MTSTQRPPHMHPDPAIRFRDPFTVSKDLTPPKSFSNAYDSSRSNWYSNARYPDLNRALTPPPEMSGVHQQQQPSRYLKENGYHYNDSLSTQNAYRAPVASYPPQDLSNHGFAGRPAVVSQPASRASPVRQAPAETNGDAQAHRRPSQANAIAANFQVPKSVNDSGGSLAELAAQVIRFADAALCLDNC